MENTHNCANFGDNAAQSGCIAVESNNITRNRRKLSLPGQKILYSVISKLPKTYDANSGSDVEMPTVVVDLRELCCAAGWNPDNYQRRADMKELLIDLTEKRHANFSLRTESGWSMLLPWIDKVAFHNHRPLVGILLSSYLKPYYLELKQNFMCVDVAMVSQLNSPKTIALYEIAKANLYKGEAMIYIPAFKETVGLEKKYEKYSDFEQRVLHPAQESINAHTDVNITCKKGDTTRRTNMIRMAIEGKTPEELEKCTQEVEKWVAKVKQYWLHSDEEEYEQRKVTDIFHGIIASDDSWYYDHV